MPRSRSLLERPRPLLPRPRAYRKRRRWAPLRAVGRLDQRLLVLMRTRGHTPTTETVAGFLGAFGEWGIGWIALGGALAAVDPARRPAWGSAAAVAPAAVPINYAVKVAIGRRRPLIEEHPMLARAPSKLSFPSAHSTSSLAAATAMSRVAPRSRGAFLALGLSIAACRPFLGMHYPSDVIAGVLLGRALGRSWVLPGVREPEVWAR